MIGFGATPLQAEAAEHDEDDRGDREDWDGLRRDDPSSSERSSVGTWTMPTASRMPTEVPMTKPSKVDESVIQLW